MAFYSAADPTECVAGASYPKYFCGEFLRLRPMVWALGQVNQGLADGGYFNQSCVNPVCYRVINHNYTIAHAFCSEPIQYSFEETA